MAEPPLYSPGNPARVLKTDRVELWHGKAEEVLPLLGNEACDLLVVDPPYGVEFESGMRSETFGGIAGDGKDKSSRDAVFEVLSSSLRVLKRNRHLYVFGPEVLAAGNAKVSAPAELIWEKTVGPSMGDLTKVWGTSHEKVSFYTNMFRHGGTRGADKLPVRMRRGTVSHYVRPSGKSVRHPSEKPVPLLQEFIESSSKVGETVLDLYAGVGSTGVAAVLAGRRTVLVELDSRYIEIARERLVEAEKLRLEMEKL